MSKYLDGWPKNFPKWNERYPCPKEVTEYLSLIPSLKYNKGMVMPPMPDFDRIFKEYNEAQK